MRHYTFPTRVRRYLLLFPCYILDLLGANRDLIILQAMRSHARRFYHVRWGQATRTIHEAMLTRAGRPLGDPRITSRHECIKYIVVVNFILKIRPDNITYHDGWILC